MEELTFADVMMANDILNDPHCFMHYDQVEPSQLSDNAMQQIRIGAASHVMTSREPSVEVLILKTDLYQQLCMDSRWLLQFWSFEGSDGVQSLKGLHTYLKRRGWDRQRIRTVIAELRNFLQELTEV